jgi:hypothetical protein
MKALTQQYTIFGREGGMIRKSILILFSFLLIIPNYAFEENASNLSIYLGLFPFVMGGFTEIYGEDNNFHIGQMDLGLSLGLKSEVMSCGISSCFFVKPPVEEVDREIDYNGYCISFDYKNRLTNLATSVNDYGEKMMLYLALGLYCDYNYHNYNESVSRDNVILVSKYEGSIYLICFYPFLNWDFYQKENKVDSSKYDHSYQLAVGVGPLIVNDEFGLSVQLHLGTQLFKVEDGFSGEILCRFAYSDTYTILHFGIQVGYIF